MPERSEIVIVGAGPAGIRAAQTLVAAGLHPIVLDENPRWGGQIYRQPPASAGFTRTKQTLYGFEAAKADAIHSTMAALLPQVDYRPETLVWACDPQRLHTMHGGREKPVPFTHLIIASGATDRVLPLPGWTLPGVYTLGGAQVALKAQGCAIGERVVFAGTGPLLYLVAYQYAKAGANVAAVLDTNRFVSQARATPRLLNQPATLAKGLYYVGWLRAHGVRIEHGVSLEGIDGTAGVRAIRWQRDGHEHTLECSAVGLGFGLRPETQLADLAGCRFVFDDLNRCWLPERDAAGRSSQPGIYLAGDGAGIAGADAAELAGRRAALALLEDLEIAAPTMPGVPDAAVIEGKLASIRRFREGIEQAFALPKDPSAHWPDDMLVCRCEEVDARTLRDCVRHDGVTEINRLKALTRVGMGRCQGRMCGEAACHLLAEASGQTLVQVGRLRAQAPIKPIPIAPMLFDENVAAIPEEARDE
ncbi:NAD(P)/FAD-dependent oxidoreductase [Pandoraea apista]|uniref:FAD/NAD(P)-dependent oxidoreductase n=1 Tax=Pandoraea apista TaxID=93218 RepID=UPI00065A247E|nr:FAD/NAD(P)-binding oxidoreductase [Pandoraea apista]ALS64651.1 FAD/NAD(P)-binding oxidoreductase [Pandoraea apista]RRW92957.1 FAD/NAD(P)-binding oxidoreductase [Pandoraea apista]RRX00369.1 FAD/NAD(P)-binding oxidoreductase [Pandoraea apista]CFB64705.1 Hydrogen cyanide synthase subunit HcnB [Pandoraea apista]